MTPAENLGIPSDATNVPGRRPMPSGDVPLARLRELAERLASGFYDSPEVLDVVARRVADETGIPFKE